MKIFIDSSSLFNKYITEAGSDTLEIVLKEASMIIVSPVTLLELTATLERRFREKTLSKHQMEVIKSELFKDFKYFHQIIWDEILEKESLSLVGKYPLRTLDAIQLASGCLSKSDLFVASDKLLLEKAKKELSRILFVG